MLFFDEATHTYRVGDDEYIPVTKYIDRFAPFNPIAWMRSVSKKQNIPMRQAKDVTDEISRLAREKGTLVHKAIEQIHNTGEENLPLELYMVPEVQAFCSFRKAHKYKVIHAEHRVWNEEWKIAGTIDCIADLEGMMIMLDFKTGEDFSLDSMYPMQYPFEDYNNCKLNKAALQMGMYRLLCATEVEMALVLHLTQFGDYNLYEVPDFRPQLLEVLNAGY